MSPRYNSIVSALLVFLSGVSYGTLPPIMKNAYAAGFVWQQTVFGQEIFGALLFLVACIIQHLRGVSWVRIGLRRTLKLLITGCVTCSTVILFSASLFYLPVAVSLTLLFQFTWIGVIIQVIVTRRAPSAFEVLAALVVIVGTICASNVLGNTAALEQYPTVGLLCAFGSAITYALFMFLSSRVETQLPTMQRGLIIALGASFLAFLVSPYSLIDGTLISEAPFGLMQGFFGLLLPILLFGLGGPALPAGVISILASSELPSSIVLSFIFLGEAVSSVQIIGIIIILVGVVIAQVPSLKSIKHRC